MKFHMPEYADDCLLVPEACCESLISIGDGDIAAPASCFRRFGDLQELRLAEVRAQDLEAGGQVLAAVEVGHAAGNRDAGNACEVGGKGEDV